MTALNKYAHDLTTIITILHYNLPSKSFTVIPKLLILTNNVLAPIKKRNRFVYYFYLKIYAIYKRVLVRESQFLYPVS